MRQFFLWGQCNAPFDGGGGAANPTCFDKTFNHSSAKKKFYGIDAALGHAWSALWPCVPVGFFALLGAGAVLSATTQGPISAVVLIMELTGRDRSFILPLILIATISTLIARSSEHRSIYDARLSDDQIAQRQKLREQESTGIGVPQ